MNGHLSCNKFYGMQVIVLNTGSDYIDTVTLVEFLGEKFSHLDSNRLYVLGTKGRSNLYFITFMPIGRIFHVSPEFLSLRLPRESLSLFPMYLQ